MLAGHIGNGTALRREWPEMNLGRQAAIVRALVSHITINPGTPGARSIDPERVRITGACRRRGWGAAALPRLRPSPPAPADSPPPDAAPQDR